MANIFQKIGSAFGQYGMDNRMPTDQFLNLPKGDRRGMQVEGLKKFGEAMNLIGAQQSGNSSRVAQAQNVIRQRQLDEEDAKRKAEQKAKQKQLKEQQDAFIAANPQYAQMINMDQLFGITPPAAPKVVTPNSYKEYERTTQNPTQEGYAKFLDRNQTPPKKTKSDFVVGILEEIQADPNYELTTADQRILDTISSTDPLEIYKRQIINSQVSKTNTQVPSISTGPVTITTQKEFDDLPKGTTYIYSGTEYVKGK